LGRPDFLCVGAQKTATSWLSVVLGRTPGVFMPLVKESHYFRETSARPSPWAGDQRRKQAAELSAIDCARSRLHAHHRQAAQQLEHFSATCVDDDWYRGIFAFAEPGEVCGEACPSNFGLPADDIDRVMRFNPEMKIILVVRDPVERVWSHLRMDRAAAAVDIEAVLSSPERRRVYLDYTDYAGSIERWRARCEAGRLKLSLFDDICLDPAGSARAIVSFLGISADADCPAVIEPVNAGRPAPIPRAVRATLMDLLAVQYRYLEQVFPEAVDRWRRVHTEALTSVS